MKLSILIAAYNVEPFIEKCIRSCYDENYKEQYEIIVVNDGSTDTTAMVAEKLVQEITNLKILNKTNEGLGAARNSGISEASGEYIWMIDGDDFIETNQLPELLQELNTNNLDGFAVKFNITDKEGTILNPLSQALSSPLIYDATSFYESFYENSYTWQYIFKRAIFTENQLAFKPSINMQDSEIFPKIIFHAKKFKVLGFVGYNYVQHPNSYTNAVSFEKRYSYFKSILAVNESLEKFKNEIQSRNLALADAITRKQKSLHHIVFKHLVFFKYENKDFIELIKLLKENDFYPLQCKPKGKLKFVKAGLNYFPILTKNLISRVRN